MEKEKTELIQFFHIGDPIGKPEVFEMESLLLYALQNKKYNGKFGGEFLQIIYFIENLLFSFESRQRRIEIIFCTQPSTSLSDSNSNLLLHELVIFHLKEKTKIPMFEFTKWEDSAFDDYLENRTPISFFFSRSLFSKSKKIPLISKLKKLRYHINFLEGISFEGFEISSFILVKEDLVDSSTGSYSLTSYKSSIKKENYCKFIDELKQIEPDLKLTTLIFSFVTRCLLSESKDEDLEYFCQVFLLQSFLIENTSLHQRIFKTTSLENGKVFKFFQQVPEKLFGIFIK
jgi:hypothetical protein